MRVEVDSSGLWGKTSEPTVFGFSDSVDRAIWIAPAVKQACLQEVRSLRGRATVNEYVRLYAIGVFLCLRPHLDRFTEIILDVEFAGRMDQVISTLFEQMVAVDPRHAKIRVRAQRIGKTSRAHAVANGTYRGDRAPDERIERNQLLELF